MNALVQRLSQGTHHVVIGDSRPSVDELKKRLDEIGYVFLKFTETRGGTNIGIQVDKAATDTSSADFVQKTGIVHIEGTLTLDYVNVRCVADIDLSTLEGNGYLLTNGDIKV